MGRCPPATHFRQRIGDARDPTDDLLREQAAYYRAGAAEYDLAYDSNPELRSLETLISGLPVSGRVLELACGTGQWTPLLAARGHQVTAVDGSPEMLARARLRAAGLNVDFIEADIFSWRAPRLFDTVFFGFWLSHVPPGRFREFWHMLRDTVTAAGRVCFVNSGPGDAMRENTSVEHSLPTAKRRLWDGSEHQIIKIFHDPGQLAEQLHELAWSSQIWPVGATLLAGYATPRR